jgi:Kdo2-lipid IVA lauroyltransferase/acyltransferase
MDPADPGVLPGGLRQDWPVPRQQVLGQRGGALAWLECQLVLGLVGAAARLPAGMRRVLVGGLARLARIVDRSHTRAAEEYLRQVLGAQLAPAELDARVLQAWKHLFEITLDAFVFERRVPASDVRAHFAVELCPEARALLERKEGCVVISAHVGDWESGPAILPWLGFDPLYAISKPPKNRWLSVHAQRVRESRGMRLVPRRGAMEFAPAVVRAGGTLVMLLDQRARKKPVLAPFFGREAQCDRSASVLLRRLRAPLVFAACYRTAVPFQFRLVVPRVVRPEEVSGKSAEEVAALVNSELEKLILAAPEQHFWLHDRWRS